LSIDLYAWSSDCEFHEIIITIGTYGGLDSVSIEKYLGRVSRKQFGGEPAIVGFNAWEYEHKN